MIIEKASAAGFLLHDDDHHFYGRVLEVFPLSETGELFTVA